MKSGEGQGARVIAKRGPHNALLPPSRMVDRLLFLQQSGTDPCMVEGRECRGERKVVRMKEGR